MYPRILQLTETLDRKSVFLLGPRQTGKSTLLKSQLPAAAVFNLLESGTFRRLSADPSLLRREIAAMAPKPAVVVIDEIQLLPDLLNEVHLLIEEAKLRFVLTGSSARALKRRGVNLLGGRATMRFLHPLVSAELGEHFDLHRAVVKGLLPAIYDSPDADADLGDYAGLYLKEEIAAEGLSRNIPAFSRFLETAALCNGTMLNMTKIASDAEVKRTTVADWFQILRDTLIGFDLPAWTKSKVRKAITTSKFYFFDVGLARYLTGQKVIERANPWFGTALETLIFHELRSFVDYRLGETLEYWRSTSGFEVDFILDQRLAIEVKAAVKVSKADCKGLLALKEEKKSIRSILVYLGDQPQKLEGIDVLPIKIFLKLLWTGELEKRLDSF
jgi:predicted AAA+ superfamily ATPase